MNGTISHWSKRIWNDIAYPISPDRHSRPGAKFVSEAHRGLPRIGTGHITNKLVVLQQSRQCLQARDLEVESGGFEAVGTRRVRGHGVGHNVAGVRDVLLAILQINRVDLAVSNQSHQPPSSDLRATPMSQALQE